jgi:hypothetical protein
MMSFLDTSKPIYLNIGDMNTTGRILGSRIYYGNSIIHEEFKPFLNLKVMTTSRKRRERRKRQKLNNENLKNI